MCGKTQKTCQLHQVSTSWEDSYLVMCRSELELETARPLGQRTCLLAPLAAKDSVTQLQLWSPEGRRKEEAGEDASFWVLIRVWGPP